MHTNLETSSPKAASPSVQACADAPGGHFGLFDAFALPRAETGALFRHVVDSSARTALDEFLSRYRVPFLRQCKDVLEYVEGALADGIAQDSLWSPVLVLLEGVATNAPDQRVSPPELLVSVAWELVLQGGRGKFETSQQAFEPLRIGARSLPSYERLTVDSTGTEVVVTLIPERTAISSGRESQKLVCFPGRPPVVRPFGHSNGIANGDAPEEQICLLHEGLERSRFHSHLAGLTASSNDLPDAIAVHRDAMRLLSEHAPGYLRWVGDAIRHVVLLRDGNGAINSGSSRAEPGVVHASVGCSAEGFAEMLVHEASHQYFYVLGRVGPVDDGTDLRLYPSPVKQCGRPIRMILLAYHAFANVALLGRLALATDYADRDGYFKKNEKFLIPVLEILEESLEQTTALTSFGESLWKPLSRELAE